MTHVLVRRLSLSVLASILLTLAGCGGGADEEGLSSGSQTAAEGDAGSQAVQQGKSR